MRANYSRISHAKFVPVVRFSLGDINIVLTSFAHTKRRTIRSEVRKSGGQDYSHQLGLQVGRLVAAPGVLMAHGVVAVPGMASPVKVAVPGLVADSLPCPGGYREGEHQDRTWVYGSR